MKRYNLLSLVVIAGGVWLAGCDEEPVRTYLAPKEDHASAAPKLAPAGMAEEAPTGEVHLDWTLPEGWKEQPSSSSMRYATLAIGGGQTECSVIGLGPEAGELAANINRWRGQLGLPPAEEKELAQTVKQIPVDGSTAALVDLQAADGTKRMLAAILPHSGRVWFFKIVGAEADVAPQKSAFDAFIASLHFVAGPPHAPPAAASGMPGGSQMPADHPPMPGMGGAQMPADHPPMPGMGAGQMPAMPGGSPQASSAAPGEKPAAIETWAVPASWRADPTPKPLRLASFLLGQDAGGEKGEVTLISLPGSAGGTLENINRWRAQVGLSPLAALKDQPSQAIQIDGQEAILVDLTGPSTQPPDKARMVVALLVRDGESWFFKMMGADKLVGQEKANFESFVRSIKFKH